MILKDAKGFPLASFCAIIFFMKNITVQCPAKINLSLKIINKRPDGYHNIDSIMQTINLFDYLEIETELCKDFGIYLNGNSNEIPYDETNLVYKAAKMFYESINKKDVKTKIYINKSIPVSAGLAGGSTDAAGTLYGLNRLYNNILTDEQLHKLCAKLGSDLNVCLKGGKIKSSGRGEIIEQLPFKDFNLSLIKPIKLGISAKEAYTKFSLKEKDLSRDEYKNDLEWAIIDDYEELKYIKKRYPESIMTGSGSTYFLINDTFDQEENYWVCNNLKSVEYGVKERP